jgi:hypothetical protein
MVSGTPKDTNLAHDFAISCGRQPRNTWQSVVSGKVENQTQRGKYRSVSKWGTI